MVLHLPEDHRASVMVRERAGWIRCRLIDPLPGQPTYSASPRITAISAFTVGGTARVAHCEVVHREPVGRSDGTPGQRFPLARRPVLGSEQPATLEVRTGEETETWHEVLGFADSGPQDRHFRIDAVAGEVQLGPAVRGPDGALQHFGSVPARASDLVMPSYRCGGGRHGNVLAGQVRVLKTSVPYVARVENRTPAVGGADAETLEEAKVRGPMLLRSRGRAVTAEDYVQLTHDVAPEVARVHCAPRRAGDGGDGIVVLVVPHVVPDDVGRIDRRDLLPDDDLLRRITDWLDERRLVGTRLLVAPPVYVGLTLVADVHARAGRDAEQVRTDVLGALYRIVHEAPPRPEQAGWLMPFIESTMVSDPNQRITAA